MFIAAKNNQLEIVQEFLDNDPTSGVIVNKKGISVLSYAALYGRLEIVQMILKNHPLQQPLAFDDKNNIALELAAECGNLAIVTLLVDICQCSRGRALQKAAANGHIEIVKFLIGNFTISDEDLQLAFLKAIYNNDEEITKFFYYDIGMKTPNDRKIVKEVFEDLSWNVPTYI